MLFKTPRYFKLPTSRLYWRIGGWIFLSVIVIETIIFIPSYLNRRKELLTQIRADALAEISLIAKLSLTVVSDAGVMENIAMLLNHDHITGGVLYDDAGREIGFFGERPHLSITQVRQEKKTEQLSDDTSRYDISAPFLRAKGNYTLIVRNDSSFVRHELFSFFLRISVLVIIISLFVTAGAWITLAPIVVTPILKLRKDLVDAGEAIAQNRPTPRFFSSGLERKDELGEVIAAFRQMYRQISDAVDHRRKAEVALQKSFQQLDSYSKALGNELDRGRQMQKNFLPDHLPQIKSWETAAFFKPARQVAGDFYDLFDLPGNCIGIVVADVCDKGVGAALFMALFRSLIRIFSGQALPKEMSVQEICKIDGSACPPGVELPMPNPFHVNALQAVALTNNYIALHHGSLSMFATLFFGVLDPETGLLTYISGGHDPLFVLFPDGGVKARLESTGPAVGVQAGTVFGMQQAVIDPGDILLGFTDGIPDATAEDGRFFSMERLLQLLDQPVPSAAALIDRIAEAIKIFTGHGEQTDDITMIALRRISRPSPVDS